MKIAELKSKDYCKDWSNNEWTNVTNYNHYVIFIFFSVYFFLTTSSYVTSVCYFKVVYILYIRGFSNKSDEDWYWPVEILYTLAFLTLFDQSLQWYFDFNSNFIFLDWSRLRLIQRWATLIVHDVCSGFSNVNLHYKESEFIHFKMKITNCGIYRDINTWTAISGDSYMLNHNSCLQLSDEKMQYGIIYIMKIMGRDFLKNVWIASEI